MNLLLTSSISRYKAEGEIEKPLMDTILNGLTKNIFKELTHESTENTLGWVSFNNPYNPNFDGSSFIFGTYIIFSLRIDKTVLPSKLVKKFYSIEEEKFLKHTKKEFLSQSEKKNIKEKVINDLSIRIPATPNVYNIIWDYEKKLIFFCTTLKTANEEFESLFYKSFKINVHRLFPFTFAEVMSNFNKSELDKLYKLSQTNFTE